MTLLGAVSRRHNHQVRINVRHSLPNEPFEQGMELGTDLFTCSGILS